MYINKIKKFFIDPLLKKGLVFKNNNFESLNAIRSNLEFEKSSVTKYTDCNVMKYCNIMNILFCCCTVYTVHVFILKRNRQYIN